jgi:arginyl-tRNA synthetase
MVKSELEKILGFEVEASDNLTFGDYSSNIALSKKSPREYAEKEVTKLKIDKKLAELVDKIEVAGPGFINFWLKKDILLDNLIQIDNQKEKYGNLDLGKGKLAIVEYSSPNIAKPFGVGHLRSTVIGDSIANLLEATGWKVMRDNHLGDWGTQFGKMIYAIKTWGDEESIKASASPVSELVKLYVKFHEESEKDESLEDAARAWFKKLEDGDSEARRIWQECVDLSWIEFNKVYELLGIKFSPDFNGGRGLGESFFETRMKPVIDELITKKLLKTGEGGAKLVFFDNDKYPPAMILKKDGATLYHTRDLATDKYRLEKYNPDLIINEVGSEQSLYFQQLFEIEKLLGWYKDGARVHVGHGLFLMEGKKMSTRAGKTVELNEVLTEAIERAKKLGNETTANAKAVGIGAIKYFDLLHQPMTNINFDWDRMFALEGNSGPYLQYTVARTNSVLAKVKNKRGNLKTGGELNSEELAVLRSLVRFPEVIVGAAKSYSPNLLCNYLYGLASKYNTFYNKHKIIGSESEDFRLMLTFGVGQVLKNGLKLLGIETPERM